MAHKIIYFHRKINCMKNAILHLNWPVVLGATLAYYAIGALWYTVLFGKYWAKHNNANMADRSGFVTSMVIGFVLNFVICATAGLLINAIHGCKMWDCFFIRSYVIIAGFVVGFVGIGLNYQKKPWGIWLVDIGYHLIALLAACFILAKWGMSHNGQ